MAGKRSGKPDEVNDVHLSPEVFATGAAYLTHAETLAIHGNTSMRSLIVECARKLSGSPFIKPKFTEAENNIFAALQTHGKRMTTSELLTALTVEDILPSEGMTKQTLSTLVRFGFLTNATDCHGAGYGLPEWSQS